LEVKDERLRLANQAMNMGCFDMLPIEGELFWDEGMYEIFEFKRDPNMDLFEYYMSVIHPDEKKSVQAAFEKSIDPTNSETRFQRESRILLPNGQVKHIEYHSNHIRDKSGIVRRIIGTCIDITERKEAESKLKSSEERMKILFDSAPDMYFLYDLKGTIIDGNNAAETLIGYKKEELIGKNFMTHII